MKHSLLDVSNVDSYEVLAEQLKASGKSPIVFTNGCFDILHPGHIQLLFKCREIAGPYGMVVVGLNSDESVTKLKGAERPIMGTSSRAMMLLALKCVDQVIVFDEDTPINLIRALRPNVIVKGGDYSSSEVIGREIAPVVIVDYDDDWSTSRIIQKIKSE